MLPPINKSLALVSYIYQTRSLFSSNLHMFIAMDPRKRCKRLSNSVAYIFIIIGVLINRCDARGWVFWWKHEDPELLRGPNGDLANNVNLRSKVDVFDTHFEAQAPISWPESAHPPYSSWPRPQPQPSHPQPRPAIYPPPPARKGPQFAIWCVAKPTVAESIIQDAMDYACGWGADCRPIQLNGPCFQPNTLVAHASFAFNSYWQNSKGSGGTCDFGGTAMLKTVDPSFNKCHFKFV